MTPGFDAWWNYDRMSQDSPYEENTPVYWAWEGWQAATRKPLSQEQIFAAARVADHSRNGLWTVVFARAIEAAHGIGNDPNA